MAITKKFSLVILDLERISDINKILVEYADSTTHGSSHVLFDIDSINTFDTTLDLSFFRICGENEKEIKDKLNQLIDKLNQLDTDYGIMDNETEEMFTTITCAGAFDIKFDNLKVIPEGTYEKIDALKNIKTEFGYCKGYKPAFRAVESKDISDIDVPLETIYYLSRTAEEYAKLKEYLTEKIMEINPDLIIEYGEYDGKVIEIPFMN